MQNHSTSDPASGHSSLPNASLPTYQIHSQPISSITAPGAVHVGTLGNQFMQVPHHPPQQTQQQGQLPLHVLQQLLHRELNQSQPIGLLHGQPIQFSPQPPVNASSHSDLGLYQAAVANNTLQLQTGLNLIPPSSSTQQRAPIVTTSAKRTYTTSSDPVTSMEDDSNDASRAKLPRVSGVQDYDFEYEFDSPNQGGGGGSSAGGAGGVESEALEQNRAKNRDAQRRFRERQKTIIGQLRADIENLEEELVRSEARAQSLEAQNAELKSKLQSLQFMLITQGGGGGGGVGGVGGGLMVGSQGGGFMSGHNINAIGLTPLQPHGHFNPNQVKQLPHGHFNNLQFQGQQQQQQQYFQHHHQVGLQPQLVTLMPQQQLTQLPRNAFRLPTGLQMPVGLQMQMPPSQIVAPQLHAPLAPLPSPQLHAPHPLAPLPSPQPPAPHPPAPHPPAPPPADQPQPQPQYTVNAHGPDDQVMATAAPDPAAPPSAPFAPPPASS